MSSSRQRRQQRLVIDLTKHELEGLEHFETEYRRRRRLLTGGVNYARRLCSRSERRRGRARQRPSRQQGAAPLDQEGCQ